MQEEDKSPLPRLLRIAGDERVEAKPPKHSEPRLFDIAAVAAECGAPLHVASLEAVEPNKRRIALSGGAMLLYDSLIVAIGARRCAWLPGARQFTGAADVGEFRERLVQFERGDLSRVAFAAPAGLSWTLPIYELALQAGHREARELALTFALADANNEDYRSALRWLEVVEQLDGVLPPGYLEKRINGACAPTGESRVRNWVTARTLQSGSARVVLSASSLTLAVGNASVVGGGQERPSSEGLTPHCQPSRSTDRREQDLRVGPNARLTAADRLCDSIPDGACGITQEDENAGELTPARLGAAEQAPQRGAGACETVYRCRERKARLIHGRPLPAIIPSSKEASGLS